MQFGLIKKSPVARLHQALEYGNNGSDDDMSDVIEMIDAIRTMDAGAQLERFTARDRVSTCGRLRKAKVSFFQ